MANPETLVPPGTWTVDCERSMIGFAVRHLKVTKVRGRFRSVEDAIRCDGSDVLSVTGLIDVASIDTGDARRDARLRTENFFDVERHPTIGVEAGSSPVSAGEGLSVCGTMTIRGVQRPLELQVEGPATPVNGDGELRVRARGAVSRRAFGLDWDSAFAAGGLLIDDRVVLLLDVVSSARCNAGRGARLAFTPAATVRGRAGAARVPAEAPFCNPSFLPSEGVGSSACG
ncbi:MAG: YceI family protein [Solirubrobacteraceae bacterium]